MIQRRHYLEYFEDGDEIVIGNGLQQPGSTTVYTHIEGDVCTYIMSAYSIIIHVQYGSTTWMYIIDDNYCLYSSSILYMYYNVYTL